jgi:transcriptional regulator with XRE-family HTH domain
MDANKQEFIELFKRSKWGQAELARRLHLTRGGVNGFITGKAAPSDTVMKLFRLVMATEGPGIPESEGLVLKEDSPPYRTNNLAYEEMIKAAETLESTAEEMRKRAKQIQPNPATPVPDLTPEQELERKTAIREKNSSSRDYERLEQERERLARQTSHTVVSPGETSGVLQKEVPSDRSRRRKTPQGQAPK